MGNHVTSSQLQTFEAMSAGLVRGQALDAYIADGEAKLREARRLRDEDYRAVAAKVGKSAAARAFGVSLSTIKNAVGRSAR